jgi:hypothetical protein
MIEALHSPGHTHVVATWASKFKAHFASQTNAIAALLGRLRANHVSPQTKDCESARRSPQFNTRVF